MHTIGAEELNREIGARPMRSRHCNEEQGQTMPLVKILGRLDCAMILSQENCLFADCRNPTRDREVIVKKFNSYCF